MRTPTQYQQVYDYGIARLVELTTVHTNNISNGKADYNDMAFYRPLIMLKGYLKSLLWFIDTATYNINSDNIADAILRLSR